MLEQDQPARQPSQRLSLPTKRDVALDVPVLDIDLIEFLKLGDCQLQSVIAEKNSSLGRFASASIALRQDIDFILLADRCLVKIEDPELQQTLSSAVEHKLKYLDVMLWNAIIAGSEYREFWANTRALYPHISESELQGALNQLQFQASLVLTRGDLSEFDPQAFEQALEVLRSGEAGALLSSWTDVAIELDQASQVVEDRAKRRPLCFKDMRSQNAEYFRNVVLERFVSGIQKDIAVINQRYYDLVLPVQELEQLFVHVETKQYKAYRQARDSVFVQGLNAVKRHVDALQPLMVQCGFIPNASSA